MKIGVVGMGLIGGCLGKAIKEKTEHEMLEEIFKTLNIVGNIEEWFNYKNQEIIINKDNLNIYPNKVIIEKIELKEFIDTIDNIDITKIVDVLFKILMISASNELGYCEKQLILKKS
mgnify:CR=1 FL=1